MKQLMSCLLLGVCGAVMAAEPALRDDGREVLLHKDGSWEFISSDVYATSASGLRVRLSQDGRWQPVEIEQPLVKPQTGTAFNDQVELETMVIQKVKASRSGGAKSTVFEQRTLALLSFKQMPQNLSVEQFRLFDNKDNDYPVLSVQALPNHQVLVQVEGAPDRWSRVRTLNLSIDKALLSTLSDIQLALDFREVRTRVVTEFGLTKP